MQRFPKLTAAREDNAHRHLHSLQRAGLAPFAVAWVYDQVACRFVLLVVAMPRGRGTIDETGRYRAAVQAVLGQGRDAPGHILAIDDWHPSGGAWRKAIALLRQPRGALHAFKIGNFVLIPAWIHHMDAGRRVVPPKWRWERVEHALAA